MRSALFFSGSLGQRFVLAMGLRRPMSTTTAKSAVIVATQTGRGELVGAAKDYIAN